MKNKRESTQCQYNNMITAAVHVSKAEHRRGTHFRSASSVSGCHRVSFEYGNFSVLVKQMVCSIHTSAGLALVIVALFCILGLWLLCVTTTVTLLAKMLKFAKK